MDPQMRPGQRNFFLGMAGFALLLVGGGGGASLCSANHPKLELVCETQKDASVTYGKYVQHIAGPDSRPGITPLSTSAYEAVVELALEKPRAFTCIEIAIYPDPSQVKLQEANGQRSKPPYLLTLRTEDEFPRLTIDSAKGTLLTMDIRSLGDRAQASEWLKSAAPGSEDVLNPVDTILFSKERLSQR